MAIFNSYVSLPEGIPSQKHPTPPGASNTDCWLQRYATAPGEIPHLSWPIWPVKTWRWPDGRLPQESS